MVTSDPNGTVDQTYEAGIDPPHVRIQTGGSLPDVLRRIADCCEELQTRFEPHWRDEEFEKHKQATYYDTDNKPEDETNGESKPAPNFASDGDAPSIEVPNNRGGRGHARGSFNPRGASGRGSVRGGYQNYGASFNPMYQQTY